MILSSWALDNRRLNLDFDGAGDFDLDVYSDSNEWMLVNSSAVKTIEHYECGHTGHLEYSYLTYSMTIRRRVGLDSGQ